MITKRALAASCWIAGAAIALTACGGSGSQSAASSAPPSSAEVNAPAATESGAVAKIVAVPGTANAVVALFPDGQANYSPDGFNLGGGGSTVAAYSGSQQVLDVVPVKTGVDALLSNGAVFFSPDGKNLGGGGASVAAYSGQLQVSALAGVPDGVDAIFANAGGAYFSPDGLHLGGGGSSARIYEGSSQLIQIISVGPGDAVVALFQGGAAFYSPDNRDLGGGGNSISATPGSASAIDKLVHVGGGVLSQLNNGVVYLSPDGTHLAGGGHTLRVGSWNTAAADGPFAPRDSSPGAQFLGHLWLSGGFADATNTNSCFQTCSYFDLWSSLDPLGTSWNSSPAFATASSPDPRDVDAIANNGVHDTPPPTDFYDPYAPIVVWNGQLTAIGATIWRSADGVHWQRDNLPDGVTAAPGPAPNRATENSRALVLGTTLYFLQPDTGEVYSSVDPTASKWVDLDSVAGFTPRCGAAAFVLAGKLWIVGGGACDYSVMYHDIWSSPDGLNWTRAAAPAAWSGRMWPCAAAGTDGTVWLAGGYAPTDWNSSSSGPVVRYGANHADVWWTRDGSTWRQLKADAGSGLIDDGGLEPRHAATCYVASDAASSRNLVLIAGTGGSDPNDGNARTLNSIRELPLPAATALQ